MLRNLVDGRHQQNEVRDGETAHAVTLLTRDALSFLAGEILFPSSVSSGEELYSHFSPPSFSLETCFIYKPERPKKGDTVPSPASGL